MKTFFCPFRINPIYGCVLACFLTPPLQANPKNPTIAAGQATFTQQGKLLTVRNTPGAIINWQQFSIGAGETTRFQQQSAASTVLNRVVGQNPSSILGALQSNGRVYLINPNGIVFGQGSKIDVAGLIASTLNISDSDFRAGKLNFSAGSNAGAVINQGSINASSGGNIYLIAPDIQNSGIINAPNGDILLAAGRSVQLVDIGSPHLRIEITATDTRALNLGQLLAQNGNIGVYGASLRNQGTISANAALVGDGGKIVFKSLQGNAVLDSGSQLSANAGSRSGNGGSINVQAEQGDTLAHSSALSANGSTGKGGNITLLGQRVGLDGTSTVNASGGSGGGNVLVGGDYQGSNSAVQNASHTYVGNDVSLKADAITKGDGGKVIVWSDDVTRAYGSASVRGGVNGGNGELVELSGKKSLDFRPAADLTAPKGKAGTLLLDPDDIVIAANTNPGPIYTFATESGDINFADGPLTTIVYENEIEGFASGTIKLYAHKTIAVDNVINGSFSSPITLQNNVSIDIKTDGVGGTGDITLIGAPIQASGSGTISVEAGGTGVLRVGTMSASDQIKLIGESVLLSGSISGGNSVEIVANGVNGIAGDTLPFIINTGANGLIKLKADRILLDNGGYSGTLNPSPGSTVWLLPKSNIPIKLGTASSTADGNFNLGASDIARIDLSAASNTSLKIGDSTAGDITLTDNFVATSTNLATLHLKSGGHITDDAGAYLIKGFNANALDKLIVEAGPAGSVDLRNSGNKITGLAGTSGAEFLFAQNGNLLIDAGGISAGTFFNIESGGATGITLNGIASGNNISPTVSKLLATNGSLIQNATGGVTGNMIDLVAGGGYVDFTVPANNNIKILSGTAYLSNLFSFSQNNAFATSASSTLGVGTNTSSALNIASINGSLTLNQIAAQNSITASAGGAGGIIVTAAGGLDIQSTSGYDITLTATAGPITFAGASGINNSATYSTTKLRAAGNISFGTGTINTDPIGGTVNLASSSGAIQGAAAMIKGSTVKALAANGIDLQTQDISYLAAKNTATGDLLIRDIPSNPSSPNPGALSIISTPNDDSITLSGLNNLAPNSNVTLKSGRPITVDMGDGDPIQISATRMVNLVSQGATAALSTINFTPSIGSVTVQAPEVKLRANNLIFSGATIISGTGPTGFVNLASSTINGAIEIYSGTATSNPALGIDKSLLSFIQSPFVGFGSSDAPSPSGNLLINTALTTGNFGGSLLGLGLMSGGGSISQSPGATLSVPSLMIGGSASVSLNEANMIGRLMARLTGGAALSVSNAQSLDIGRFVPGGTSPAFEGVSTQGGNITLNVTGNLGSPDISLGSNKEIDAGTADINLTTTGNMALRGVAGNRVQLTAGGNIGGFSGATRAKVTGNILLASANGTQGVVLDTDINKLNISAANGNIDISEAGDVAIGSVSTNGDFTLLAAGNILDDNASGVLNVTASTLNARGSSVSLDTVIAQTARIEGTGTGSANIVRLYDLGNQAAPPLNITAISAGNPIDIGAKRTIQVDANGPTGGNIRIKTANTAGATPSDIRLGAVKTLGGNIDIEAAGAIIDGNDTAAGPQLNLEAANLNLLAANGIGAANPLETRVSKLAVESSTGNVELTNNINVELTKALLTSTAAGATNGDFLLDNTGAVTISGAVRANNGSVGIIAHSPILVTASGSINALKNISLTTGDDGSAGDTLTLNGALTAQQGNINLLANDSLLVNANITNAGSGAINLKSTAGGIQMAPSTRINSAGGSIDCIASGDILLSQLSTGSLGSVAITSQKGVIGSSTTGNNITTGNMLLAAAKGISGVGFSAKNADVSSTSGFVTITNTDTGTVISDDPAVIPPVTPPTAPPTDTDTSTDASSTDTANQITQTVNGVIVAANSASEQPGDLGLNADGNETSDEKNEKDKKDKQDVQKDNNDGTTKKAGLPVCK